MKGFLWCPHCGSPHALDAISCLKTGNALEIGARHAARGLHRGSIIADRYKVRGWAATESVAQLYMARHVGTQRRVIVKMVHDDGPSREDREAEILDMQREAIAAAMVEHPHVAPVLDFGMLGPGEAFLVRERCAGGTLTSALRTAGALPVADASEILAQILSGLHALHEVGIVHRDLGTHNISMLNRTGCRPLPNIAGLGRCSAEGLGPPQDGPSGIHYSSPELLAGGEVDLRTDLFSCGVILFEMLTGRRPFEAGTTDDVREAILRDAPPLASQLAPHLGAYWLEVLGRALNKDPAQRYQDALEFQQALLSHDASRARLRSYGGDVDQDLMLGRATTLLAEQTRADLIGLPDQLTLSRAAASGASKCDRYIGRRIADRYDLESLVGSGSAGAVYKARHLGLDRPVAVKVLHDRNRTSAQAVERFKAEAHVASRLDHPNIARVLDFGEEPDGTLYLVMEYLEGATLEAVLATERRLSADRAVGIAIQLLSALVVAHAAGIVHRDIKPENVMLLPDADDDGRSSCAKVCDFGIAKLYQQDRHDPELTNAGLLLGSPAYMAPEQIRAEACDARTDLYATGVTLFEMLTGRLPHDAPTMAELFQKKLSEPPSRPSALLDIDPLLEDIIMRALEACPDQRHSSAAELRSELVEALRQLQPTSSPPAAVTIWPERNS